jgi:hemoglobin
MENQVPANDLCSDEEVTQLVHAFYAKVRRDDMLGPIFNSEVEDWDHHLAKLVDFWSSILRGTGSYTGTPMQKHVALDHLDPALFQRWLALFEETIKQQTNQAMGERAYAAAQRIAQSLWYGYQMSRNPDALPTDLPGS